MDRKVMKKHMYERFRSAAYYSLKPSLPASLNLELNNTCNHKCVFCTWHSKHAAHPLKPAVMEVDFAKRILDQAKELGIGRKEVGFYLGGEPLLYKELPEIIQYAKSLGFQYTFLTTNGTPATKERMEELADAGLDSIRFSVNGADREMYQKIHGADAFGKVVENIRHLHEYREKKHLPIAISLSCVVTKKTVDVRPKMENVFSGYVDDFLFIPVMTAHLNVQNIQEEYALVDDSDSRETAQIDFGYICPLLFETMYINSSGKVMPCCRAYDVGCVFADLHENFDLEAAWYNETYERYRRIFAEGASDGGTICKICTLRRTGVGRLSMDGEADFSSNGKTKNNASGGD